MAAFVELSGVHMRRRVVLNATFVATQREPRHVVLASLLNPGSPPQPVPLDDPMTHALQAPHQRVLVRPPNLVTPSATFVGSAINVVRV